MMNNMNENNNLNLTERPLSFEETKILSHNLNSLETSRREDDALAASGIFTIPGILICLYVALKFFGII